MISFDCVAKSSLECVAGDIIEYVVLCYLVCLLTLLSVLLVFLIESVADNSIEYSASDFS